MAWKEIGWYILWFVWIGGLIAHWSHLSGPSAVGKSGAIVRVGGFTAVPPRAEPGFRSLSLGVWFFFGRPSAPAFDSLVSQLMCYPNPSKNCTPKLAKSTHILVMLGFIQGNPAWAISNFCARLSTSPFLHLVTMHKVIHYVLHCVVLWISCKTVSSHIVS